MSPDEKWELVRKHYENAYREKNGDRIRFHLKPSEKQIDFLYESMVKLQKSLHEFYHDQSWLMARLNRFRGLITDPVKKRRPDE